jgi:hypothetical protein
VDHAPNPYSIRIDGYLGPTALSAFPDLVSQLKGGDTLLTGLLDRSALYGVLAEIGARTGPRRAPASHAEVNITKRG